MSDTTRVVVCATSGIVDAIPGIGMAEGEFYATDVDGDGRDEIFFGATTVSAAYSEVATLVAGRLRTVRDAKGDELAVETGDAPDTQTTSGYGCLDVDGDGHRDIVTATFERQSPRRWKRITYSLHDASVRIVAQDTGRLGTQPNAAAAVIPSCRPAG